MKRGSITRQADHFVELPYILAELSRRDSRIDPDRHPKAIKSITVRPWGRLPKNPIGSEKFVTGSGLRLLVETEIGFSVDVTYIGDTGFADGNSSEYFSGQQFENTLEQMGADGRSVLHNLAKLTRRTWRVAGESEEYSFTLVVFITKVTNPLIGLVGCWIDLYPVPKK